MSPPIYVASRVKHAGMWRACRSIGHDMGWGGWNIVSTWIDEADEGQTADLGELWARIESEIRASKGLVLYAQRIDFPLKGALIEAGMALAVGIPVAVVLSKDVELENPSCRPIGSWIRHPRVSTFEALSDAHRWIVETIRG